MKWSARIGTKRFVIEHDEGGGFYLYVFDAEKCTHDYLQDKFEFAVQRANEDFDVPASAWTRLE